MFHQKADRKNGRDREREGGEDGAKEEVDGALELVLASGFDGTQALGSEDEKGDDHAGERSGELQLGGAEIKNDGEFFGEKHHREEACEEKKRSGSEACSRIAMMVSGSV